MANLKTDVYEVVDDKGNVVDTLRFPEGGSLYKNAESNRNAGVANTVYRGSTDSQEKYEPLFSKDDIKAATSVNLDKKTGKITIKAPSMVTKNPTFKKQVTEAMSAISQNYKLNPDYKYALMSDSEETKTSEQWVDEIKGNIKEMAVQAAMTERAKDKAYSEDGVKLSDEDVTKMSAIALEYNDETGQTVLVKDSTTQALPEKIKNLNVFANLDGWDETSHMVKWGDLKKVWDREANSDEDILEVFKVVDEYFSKKDFSDPTEYAEMIAFRQFIYGKDPDVSFWRNVAETVGETMLGVLTGAASFDVGILSAIEGIRNWAAGTVDSLAGSEHSKKEDWNFAKDYLAPELENWVGARRKETQALSDARAGWGAVTNSLTPVAMQIAVSVAAGNAASKFAAAKVSNSASRIINSVMAKYEASVEGLMDTAKILGFSGDIPKLATAINGAEGIAKSVYVGTDLMLKLMTVPQQIQVIGTAINSSMTLARTVGVVSKGADILAQAITDVALSDPKLFRTFMESDDTEAKAYAIHQLTANASGEVIGVMLGKGLVKFGSTEVGTVLQAKTAPRISQFKAWIGQKADDIKTVLHSGNENWLLDKTNEMRKAAEDASGRWYSQLAYNRAGKYERKLQNLVERRITRAANAKIGELAGEVQFRGNTWDEIYEAAKGVKGEMADTLAQANNLINMIYTRDVSATVAKFYMDDPELLGARDSYLDALTKVINAENAAGLGKGRRVIELQENLLKGGKNSGKIVTKKGQTFKFGIINEETNEYILAQYRVERADATIRLSKVTEDVKGAEKEKAYYEGIIESFRSSQPKELVDAADNLLAEGRKLSGLTQDLRVREGVLAKDALDSMRNSGYFDEGYMRTQRAKQWGKYRKEGGELKISELRDEQQFHWGNTEDKFQDISLVLFDDINEVARQTNRKKMVDMLDGLGFKVDIVVDEETTRIVSETPQRLTSEAAKKIEAHTDSIVRDSSDTALFSHFFDKKKANWFVNKANTEAVEAGGKVASAKASTVDKVTRADRHRYFSTINEGDLDDLLASDVRSAFSIGVVDDDSLWNFRNKLDSTHKKILDAKMASDIGDQKLTKKELEQLYTLDNFRGNVLSDNQFMDGFKRSYAEKNFNKSSDDIIATLKEDAAVLRANTLYKENLAKLSEIRKKYDLPSFNMAVTDDIEDFIETAIENNYDNKEINKVMSALAGADAGVDDLVEYSTLQSLYKNRKNVEGQFYSAAKARYNEILTDNFRKGYSGDKALLNKKLAQVDKMAEEWANETSAMLVDRIEERYAETVNRLMQQGSDLVTDEVKKTVFQRIAELNKEVSGASKVPNVVKTYGAFGYEEYVELSPTIADMFTTMPRPIRRGPFGALQQSFVRTFRFGTTGGLVPGSLVNQAFRDVGNAVVVGDAVKSNMRVEQELAAQFGDVFAQEYQRTVPDVYATLLKQSKETGEDINRLIARREMDLGALNVGAQMEKNIYRFGREAKIARNETGVYDANVFNRITDGLDEFSSRLEFLNTARESYLRKRVYNNNLLKAMKEGLSVQQARNVAEFIQSEATTNFVRQSYHLANLTKTVPYLGSAINGTKSFWRLASWDPIGVSTRIIGGYVVPVIALTNMSLASEENRRIYKQIPEYEKAEHLTFVLGGQKLSIPIPQEISNFVVPVQHMIESMQGTSDHSFEELMANDLLGAFPVELDGFMNIDADELLERDIWTKSLLPGFAKVSSSLMPPLAKSGFMMVTGYDPYTMKRISRTNVQVDNETGEQMVMDYTSGQTAKLVGSIMGDFMSAPMAQKVLGNLFGQGGILIGDGIITLAQSVIDPKKNFFKDGVMGVAQSYLEHGLSRLYIPTYGEESNLAWNRAVSALWDKKNELLNDESYKKDLKAISSGNLSEEALNTVKSRVKSRQQEYMQQVLDAATNLNKKYDGTFDKYKFASVISLVNLDSDTVNSNPFNAYATYLSKQDWNLNKAAAVETMAEMGFSGPNDGSIFGYYAEDQDGNITIKYNSPINILNYDLSNREQDKIAFAAINKIVQDEGLYDKMQAVDKQVNAIYAKKNLTKQDRANIEQLQINWNAEVAKAIAPVVSRMTPEAAINNKKVKDLLYTYIYVPSSYAVNNKGRFVSLGDDGSKKGAYYQSWIKRMFGIKDPYKGQY